MSKNPGGKIIMKMFFVLVCSLALASVARGADPQNSPAPKKGAAHSQASQHPTGGPGYSGTGPGHAVGAGHTLNGPGRTLNGPGRTTGTGPGHAVGAGPEQHT